MAFKRTNKSSTRLAALLVFTFLSAFIVTQGHAQVASIPVELDGTQEVLPVATVGTGVGDLFVNTATGEISGVFEFSGLTTPTTAGHIHNGAAGVNGPIIVPLIGGVGVTEGSMSVPAGTVLPPAQLDALMSDGLYVNIHTSANPGGEIRGQIFFSRAM
jgi:hypothetical protein